MRPQIDLGAGQPLAGPIRLRANRPTGAADGRRDGVFFNSPTINSPDPGLSHQRHEILIAETAIDECLERRAVPGDKGVDGPRLTEQAARICLDALPGKT